MWRYLAAFAVLCVVRLAPVAAQVEPLTLRRLVGDNKFTALVEQGRSALSNKQPDRAVLAFEEAYRYMPRPVLLYYLARAAVAEGRTRAAIDLYRRYIEQMGDDAEPEVKNELSQIVQQPLEVGAELTVVGDASAFVTVDGRLVGTLPLVSPVLLATGKHQVVLFKYPRRVETTVHLLPRRTAEVRFTLKPPLAVTTLTPGVLLFIEPQTLEPQLQANLRKTVSEAVGRQRAVLVSEELQPGIGAQRQELHGCLEQPSCQEKLALESEAKYVLRLSFQTGAAALAAPVAQTGTTNPTAYRVTATVLDVEVGAIAASVTDGCVGAACNKLLSRIGELVSDLLRTAASKPRGTLKVSSEPTGATVKLGTRTMGTTPVQREAFVGPQDLTLVSPGYHPLTETVLVEDMRETTVHRTLLPLPVKKPSLVRPALKWSLLGVGFVAATTGIALLAVDGRTVACSGGQTPPCVFDGRAAGATLVTIGALSLGGSLATFLW